MTGARGVSSRTLLFVLVAAVLGRALTLGIYPLMDTTEARYAEIARKMVELNDWVTPWSDYGVPFWAKPPLSFWLTSASFKLFGINEIAARLPHWLAGIGVAWMVWDLSVRRSHREALYASALLFGSVLFFIAAGAVMTDMTLVLSTTLAMRGFWLGLHGDDAERKRERWLLFVAAGVGLLAKGPIALVLIALPIASWAVTTRSVAIIWRSLPWFRGGLVALGIALPWYALAEWRTPGFLDYFLYGEHWQRFLTPGWKGDLYGSAHNYPHGTIWLFAFVDLLPWTILLPIAALVWRKTAGTREAMPAERDWRTYLLLWGLAPAVFFTAAGNVLWPYVLPGIPALTLWASGWLARQPQRASVERLLIGGMAFTLILSLTFLVALPFSGFGEIKSTKALVVDYELHRTDREALIFLGKRPLSGAFYSRGLAEEVPDIARLAQRLKEAPGFVAVKTDEVRNLPEGIVRMLRPVGHHGGYALFVAERPIDRAHSRGTGIEVVE